ncbi:RNA chaperone Hfq [Bacillus sp. CDB3]|uniref:RNA chaperone Hfq n=1 Tax=Bacillus sp. CDB3 TaxID=360310 RepID=UPI0009D7B17C|nr:RNA chaperone Hfq [Bacillus sp. CDB3]OQR53494.1 RNA chaperone Hfq [Bacillus sp. CDB3]
MERKVQTVQKERTRNTVSFQDRLIQEAMQKKKIVTLILLKGFQIKGTIKGYDAFSILIESEGKQQLLYKHVISTVRL